MLDQLKRILSLSIGLFLSVYSLYLITQEKIHFGVLIPLVIGVALMLYALCFNQTQVWLRSFHLRRKIWTLLWLLFFIWIISVFLFFTYIQKNKEHHNNQNTPKAIIVLGGGVENAQPTPTLQNRLDRAATYAQQTTNTLVIVSGGLVFGQSYSEAEIMRNYLLSHYPDLKNSIQVENKSSSTALNLKYSAAILKQQHIALSAPITLVTSDFHTLRAKAIAKHQGYSNVTTVSAVTPLYIRYHSWLREYFAYISGFLLGEY